MARAPSGEGGRLAAKPQTGRGLGTAETNLVAAFSWQGSHGPGGVQFQTIIAVLNCLKGGSFFPKLTLYQGFGYKPQWLKQSLPYVRTQGSTKRPCAFFPKVAEIE